jgi:uncharacterized protein YdiU (UPF0061 family)
MKKICVCLAFVYLAMGLFEGCSNRAQERQRYKIKAQSLGKLIAGQAQACVSQSRAYQAVWEYAKVSEMDFETAAAEMLGPETKQDKTMMIEHKTMIENLLEELKDPPSEFEETYRMLGELYEIYVPLHDLAMDPLDDMEKHMKSVNELYDRIVAKTRDLDATWVVR